MAMLHCIFVFGFVWLSNAQTTVSSTNGTEGCDHNKADIIFLLDASYSEGSANFKKQLDFVSNFTNGYDIGPDKVQIGVVTFASSPHNAFYLNTYNDKPSLVNGIQNVPYKSGGTSTDDALKYVRTVSFTSAHGGRYGVPKILVVMTDGQSSDPTGTATEARIIHYSNIKVIAIGIGSGVQSKELNAIATDSQHAFTVPSFDSLQTIEKEIQTATCVSEKIDLQTCESKKADIVFVLDGSGSETAANFQKQLEFVSNVTNTFDIGPNG
ncbi:collagen alpha-4(VI) chain-like, partial [Ruditapes philippinarum]|uniref:collagen alpha-4(VI) chain-like n=1 Tax=Ruditapes philippinarum TaxID=129788 RepID=UPI00295A9E83